MVHCDRCHSKFSSYSALKQHYHTKHPNAKLPAKQQSQLNHEVELTKYTTNLPSLHRSNLKLKAIIVIAIALIAGASYYFLTTPRECSERSSSVSLAASPEDFRGEIAIGLRQATSDQYLVRIGYGIGHDLNTVVTIYCVTVTLVSITLSNFQIQTVNKSFSNSTSADIGPGAGNGYGGWFDFGPFPKPVEADVRIVVYVYGLSPFTLERNARANASF